jgi:hypothetical protein
MLSWKLPVKKAISLFYGEKTPGYSSLLSSFQYSRPMHIVIFNQITICLEYKPDHFCLWFPRLAPDQYTITTVPVKILRLLATDLTAKIEEEEDQAAESDYDDEDEFGDDDWEDEESTNHQKDKFAMLSDFLDASGLDMEGEEDEEQEADPDVLSDPVYQMNLKDYLVDFFRQCVQQNSPAFAQSASEMSDVEKRTLQTLLEN